MRALVETIVAPITGSQAAAVAVVRLSGPEAWAIARVVFRGLPDRIVVRHAYFGRFTHGDEGLMLLFEEGRSFTGEETAEMNIHGSRASVRQLVAACVRAGARLAEPGEFTRRAWMNGRMDLSQAEGVLDTVEAMTARQLRSAHTLREGGMRHRIQALRETVLGALATVEAHVDFSEELGDLPVEATTRGLDEAADALRDLIEVARGAEWLRTGATVALIGPPNAGKSSLLNALTRSDRAIVTPIPGTTRDSIEVTVELDGLLVRLIDTAGIRDTTDEVESMGIERSMRTAEEAHLRLVIYDAAEGEPESLFDQVSIWGPTLLVANKCDLATPSRGVRISCKTGDGLERLAADIAGVLVPLEIQDEPIANARQLPLLESALQAVQSATETLRHPATPDDLAAVHLRETVITLGAITGETASVDMVDEIFSRFCLGK